MKTPIKVSRCNPGKACRLLPGSVNVRRSVPGTKRPGGLRTVLVPVDFSPRTAQAVQHALSLTATPAPRIVLFSAAHPVAFEMDYGYGPVVRQLPDAAAIKQAAARLGTWARRNLPADRHVELEIGNGRPAEEIARVAREREADCIVICTRRRPSFEEGRNVSTADELIHCAPCPLIVLHEE
jgi:nucleotide-binding universal stress UspA family protein